MALVLHTYKGNKGAEKALIAAEYTGVQINVPDFEMGVSNKTPEFLKMNPIGKVPVLETPEGPIFESNAIARYVSRLNGENSLNGSSLIEYAQIEQWIDFSSLEIFGSIFMWFGARIGYKPYSVPGEEAAISALKRALDALNTHLTSKTFLVGHSITLADIITVCNLSLGYTTVMTKSFTSAFPHVERYFWTVINQPNFKKVVGDVKQTEAVPPVASKKPAQPAKAKEEPKKKAAPAAEAPKPVEEEEAPKPKAKNPLDLLPPSPMVLDEWKRLYSNTKSNFREVAIKGFRNRKQKPSDQTTTANGETHVPNGDNVFRSLEEKAEDRHRRILAAKKAAADDSDDSDPARSKLRSNGYDYDDSDTEAAVGKENVKAEEKKPKVKKEKKPKVTLGEAAAKIDASNLEAFLFEASESYASQPEIQLMRFADYFGRALSGVSSSHFPWVKTFKESPLSKLIDIPLSHIPEAVCKTSADWINQRPIDALGAFVLWALDCILADLAVQQGSAKGGKKGAQQHATSKSQVAIFVTVALVLRRKPDALTNVLPTLRENPKYQGQDKLPVVVWMMAQASQGDISVGLYCWAHNLLPVVSSKSCNPQSRDLILQLVERILSNPKARTILVNGAVRKGERLIPPPSFEILMRLAFPASSARVKATERFEAIYPLLKEVSLAGVPGSKAMKQVTQQIFTFALKAAGEGNAVLAKEAAAVTIWAITQNVDCCKHWENLYNDNLEASVIVLKKLIDQWKERSVKLTPADTLTLNRTMKSLRLKNEEALEGGAKGASMSLYKDADKCCKVISGKLSSGSGVIKGLAIVAVLAAAGAAAISANPEAIAELKGQVESWDLNKITESVMTAFKN